MFISKEQGNDIKYTSSFCKDSMSEQTSRGYRLNTKMATWLSYE
jgi:hypothetical protein